ncbi:hypothetical protein [Hymenobacter actinosclerus]|uniref:Uncharacterized protein n=1 Tax=Hymenobacter actinosclerus TaxID=82805 RepID=A0A1I0BRU8_9BACT|nr:hypothetical protein [Hymenobacter actinosclerus]SET09033.1 hypothetical protein SAMN04487998_1153 [Hymenobacter actinosclerus]
MANKSYFFPFLPLALLLAGLPAAAQQVSFSELVSFYEGGPAVAQQTLLPRGWLYTGEDTFQDSREHCAGKSVLFGLPLTPPDSTGYGHWINVDTEGNCHRVVGYQTWDKEAMATLKRELKTQYQLVFDNTTTAWEGGHRVTRFMYLGPKYRAQIIETTYKIGPRNRQVRYALYVGKQPLP